MLTGDVRILDAENACEVWSLKGHTLLVHDVAFSPDGQRLVTLCRDSKIRLWDLASGQEILKLSEPGFVERVQFVSDGRRLIGAANDRTIHVWDATPLPD